MRHPTRRRIIEGAGAIAVVSPFASGFPATAAADCNASAAASARLADYRQHLAEIRSASFGDHAAAEGARVESADEFEKMRSHLLEMYEPMAPSHSFMDDYGLIWDVIPVADQPSLRNADGSRRAVAAPPPAPAFPETSRDKAKPIPSPFTSDRLDRFGNRMSCPDGHIPMRRLTMAGLSRYPTLFAALTRRSVDHGDHAYAIGEQDIACVGVGTTMSIFAPAVNANQTSISQLWLSAGSRGSLQTIESGAWSNCEFETSQPTFFLLASSNGYQLSCQNLGKCYNSVTGKSENYGFVHTQNIGVPPGGVFPNVSSGAGSDTYIYSMSWLKHDSGNWWLYVSTANELGNKASGWMGYFPGEIFAGGGLETAADTIQFGGEAAIYSSETTFAPMGNGQEPTSVNKLDGAFHSDTFYVDTDLNYHEATLVAQEDQSGPCYGVLVDNGADLYFGGPGGTGCPIN